VRILVLISADAEWTATLETLGIGADDLVRTPYGDCFTETMQGEPIVFLHGGWGKVAAAASAEYAIGRWNPEVILNLGTCGGIEGRIRTGEKILVTRTIIYDIHEAIGESAEAVEAYSTTLDLDWLGSSLPLSVTRAPLVSADADLVPAAVEGLVLRHAALAADWESGAIAYVARRRQQRLLIIREVSDVVSPREGEVLGNLALFRSRAAAAMRSLLNDLRVLVPFLLERLSIAPTPRSA
jgi:adenosylhomocysteine nucleosidase